MSTSGDPNGDDVAPSEIADLVSISMAVDDAVVADAGLRTLAAALLPAYRDESRFGWASGFRDRLAVDDEDRVPSFDGAIERLGTATKFANLLPRRLLAVAVLARVFPEWFGPHGEHRGRMHLALMTPGVVEGLGVVPTSPPEPAPLEVDRSDPRVADRARRLLIALADPEDLQRIEDWHAFLRRHDALVNDQLLRLPAPGSTSTTELPASDGRGPIAILQTDLCIGDVPIKQVVNGFLNPERWPTCNTWWCRMTAEGGAPWPLQRFREVVALDCVIPLLKVDVKLDFAVAVTGATRTVVTYNMSPVDQPDAGVDVDRGVIDVRVEGDHIRVRTTKRVRFTIPVDMAAVAMIADWIGYGEAATDLICNCSGGTPRALDCGPRSPFEAAIDRIATLARACLADAKTEAGRISARSDTGEVLVGKSDLFRLVPLAAQSWAKIATATADAIGAFATSTSTTTTTTSTATSSTVASTVQRSGPFSFAPPLSEECSLLLVAQLESPYEERVDSANVTIVPGRLGPGPATFSLDVLADDLEGTAYVGQVKAIRTLDNQQVGLTDVDVIVP